MTELQKMLVETSKQFKLLTGYQPDIIVFDGYEGPVDGLFEHLMTSPTELGKAYRRELLEVTRPDIVTTG
jgi:hypothetical protein